LHELTTIRERIGTADLAAPQRAAALEAVDEIPALFREFCDPYHPRLRGRLLVVRQAIMANLRADARTARAVEAAFDALCMQMGVEVRRSA
jgi:hypothetical protein